MDLATETRSYDHRVALFRRLNARYVVEACNDLSCVSSEELSVTGTLSGGVGTITHSNNTELDGSNFVSLSGDGRTLAVGSSGEDSASSGINGDEQDNSSENTGAVRVYRLINNNRQQQAFIKASNPDPDDRFGRALSLSADGNTLAVGVEDESSAASGIDGNQNDNSLLFSGAVYVFSFADGQWQQQLHIEPGNQLIDGGRVFSSFISLSENGNTLAVGGSPGFNLGGTYILVRNDGTWSQQWYFDPEVISAHPSLGFAGALSDDGKTLTVSATRDFIAATGINADPFASTEVLTQAGAVHVFVLVDWSWRQQAYIKSALPQRFADFGRSVTMSPDGNTIAVLSRDDTGDLGVFEGYNFITTGSNIFNTGFQTSVHIFHRNSGIWSEAAYIKPPLSTFVFPGSMALNATGDTLAIAGRLPPALPGDEDTSTPLDSVVFTY